jgi:hypothetical protein
VVGAQILGGLEHKLRGLTVLRISKVTNERKAMGQGILLCLILDIRRRIWLARLVHAFWLVCVGMKICIMRRDAKREGGGFLFLLQDTFSRSILSFGGYGFEGEGRTLCI